MITYLLVLLFCFFCSKLKDAVGVRLELLVGNKLYLKLEDDDEDTKGFFGFVIFVNGILNDGVSDEDFAFVEVDDVDCGVKLFYLIVKDGLFRVDIGPDGVLYTFKLILISVCWLYW